MKRQGALESAIKTGESRYGLLLVILFVLLLIYPFLGYHEYLSWLFSLTWNGRGCICTARSTRAGAAYFVTLVLGFACTWQSCSVGGLGWKQPTPRRGTAGLFFSQMIVMIFTSIMRSKHVSKDTVLGASCIFVMIALAFGSAYVLLEWFIPGAFHIPDVAKTANSNLGAQSLDFELVYFSLVTMTTLGYGDILPLAPTARALASFEAMISQLYLAIIIARLVGLEIATRLQNQPNE